MALVLVLAVLVLITLLVISFFVSVSAERTAAGTYADGLTTRELSDSVINLVQAQIIEGTRSMGRGSNNRLAWASQPGAIRTYDDAGAAVEVYKLYSAAEMVESASTGFDASQDLPGGNWHASTEAGVFTDLNTPVLVPNPQGTILRDGESFDARYPIVDPSAEDLVEGFAVSGSVLGYGGNNPPNSSYDPTAPTGSGTSNPAPMPVRWLYLLEDGNFIAPAGADAEGVVSFPAGPVGIQPTASNPIIGRVAFWTDDETSKVNINTASEGTFWDRPWAGANADSLFGERRMADRIPARNEFQRFPGHPAATSLSAVLGSILPIPADDAPGRSGLFDSYYELAPRVGVGGTEAGTSSASSNPIVLSNDRLFSSVDELFFSPGSNNGLRDDTPLPADFLGKSKFFLTAHSRAPEVNLWNLPRISLWPIQAEATQRNAKDRLIAYCSTVGGNAYHFSRLNAWGSSTPSSQSPTLDWTAAANPKIARNHALYQYLQRLTAAPIPGFGGTFAGKYGTDRDQILTEAVDLIRSGLNTTSSGLPPFYNYVQPGPVSGSGGEHQVTPLVPPPGTPGAGTKGFGRFNTVTGVAIQFYGAGTVATPPTTSSPVNNIGAVLFLNLFNPTPGPPVFSVNQKFRIRWTSNFSVNGNTLNFLSGAVNNADTTQNNAGAVGATAFNSIDSAVKFRGARKTFGVSDANTEYPFYSQNIVPINPTSSTFSFSGGEIAVDVFAGSADPSVDDPIQTLTFEFPAQNLPRPNFTSALFASPVSGTPNPVTPLYFSQKRWVAAEKRIDPGDTVRMVRVDPNGPSGGDLRHIAALPTVDKSYFSPGPNYTSTTQQMAHSLRTGDAAYRNGNISTSLIPGVTQLPPPASPAGQNGAFLGNPANTIHGDWDNGNGIFADGAFINKPDAGNQNTASGGYFSPSSFNSETGETFSPNRQVASAVMFGSLPTGVVSQKPWQTLLFNPHPASGFTNHPGAVNPPDHIFLDWFHMPIVEPYAISEPLSTAGKINMNYALAPFGHIQRNTGVRAVLKSLRIMAIPDSAAATYKVITDTTNFRYPLNLNESNGTLRGFEARFESGEIFRSASEVTTISLVPEGAGNPTYDTMESWWSTRRLTGDNARESPYNHIYPRLTTKSNTFTVHMRVQALKKSIGTPATQWVEDRDQINGEYRGSAVIERYIDPQDPGLGLVDFATQPDETLDRFYRFRVLNSNRFNP